ncbi:MAG: NAD(P)H-hydrate dehydratase [Candidatus Brocadiia bacterium]
MDLDTDEVPVLPRRRSDAHKGDFGHVLVVGGSPGMGGAARLAAISAQLPGSGLTTLACPSELEPAADAARDSIMTRALPSTDTGALGLRAALEVLDGADGFDICALGPGLGGTAATECMVRRLVSELSLPMVIDADGLNALAEYPAELRDRTETTILTPHPGEMGRLLGGVSPAEVQSNRMTIARDYASEYRCVVVLKGRGTVVTDGDSVYVNETGNPGMGVGGMGDVLTGLVAGLMGQGLDPVRAARLGVFIHGLAGDTGAAEVGAPSLIPETLLQHVPEVLVAMEELRDRNRSSVCAAAVIEKVLG